MRILVSTDFSAGGGMGDSPRVRPIRAKAFVGMSTIDCVRAAGGMPLLLAPGEPRLEELLKQEVVEAYRIVGRSHDCGSKLGYLQANIAYALQHEEIGEAIKDYLNNNRHVDAAATFEKPRR